QLIAYESPFEPRRSPSFALGSATISRDCSKRAPRSPTPRRDPRQGVDPDRGRPERIEGQRFPENVEIGEIGGSSRLHVQARRCRPTKRSLRDHDVPNKPLKHGTESFLYSGQGYFYFRL